MRPLALAACVAVAGCAAPVATPPREAQAPSIALRNAGFESAARAGERCPAEWSCTMHADPNAFRFVLDAASAAEGRQSLCIERVTPEPWAVASQSVPAQSLRGRRLRFSIALRGEKLAGPGAGPWVLVHGPAGMLAHEERIALAGSAWERRTIEFDVPAQAISLDVGATLQGAGRVCIDDARLEPA